MARARNQGNGRQEESLQLMQQAQAQMLQALANLAQNQTAMNQNQTATNQNLTAMNQNLTAMNQNQTALLACMAETEAEIAALRRDFEETKRLSAERFERLEALLTQLPEAVHRRFGFPAATGLERFALCQC